MGSQDKDYIKNFFTQTDYHTLKDDNEGFKFIFDGMIFDAKKVSETHSKLEVYSFNQVQHGPYKLDVNFLALITKYGSLFTIRRGPIVLDSSMQYAKRDMITEVDLFKKLNPTGYEKISQGK
jgi:hypothetical protein